MENLPVATQVLKNLLDRAEADWEKVIDTDNGDNHVTAWRKINIEGKPSTAMQIKLIETFPNATPDQFWELVTNFEKRKEWDTERVTNAEKLGDGENGGVIYHFDGKKPPIPMVSARDVVVNTYKDETNFGEGKRAFIMTSVEHETYPVKSDPVRLQVEVIATIVEANPSGNGTMITEIRSVDLGGNMFAIAIDKGSKMGP